MSKEMYMQRCLQLAALGAGRVAPNPMVGAVLVHDNAIIGEGWHRQYGQAHAEVNCVNAAIEAGYESLLSQSVMHVSLEPCAHFGKTPPCADLIIRHKIPKVVIGCRDPFDAVNGKGMEKLKAAGVYVQMSALEKECEALNKRFFTFHTSKRPFVILKWAETADGFISAGDQHRLLISNEYSNRLVHRWRSEEAAILVARGTAIKDDPALTNRLWTGPSPMRMVIDRQLKLPASLQVFDRSVPTIIFNTIKQEEQQNLVYYKLREEHSLIKPALEAMHKLGVQSVLVEGGAQLINSFIAEQLWDEARIIQNDQRIGAGLRAPLLKNALKMEEIKLSGDIITLFKRTEE